MPIEIREITIKTDIVGPGNRQSDIGPSVMASELAALKKELQLEVKRLLAADKRRLVNR